MARLNSPKLRQKPASCILFPVKKFGAIPVYQLCDCFMIRIQPRVNSEYLLSHSKGLDKRGVGIRRDDSRVWMMKSAAAHDKFGEDAYNE